MLKENHVKKAFARFEGHHFALPGCSFTLEQMTTSRIPPAPESIHHLATMDFQTLVSALSLLMELFLHR